MLLLELCSHFGISLPSPAPVHRRDVMAEAIDKITRLADVHFIIQFFKTLDFSASKLTNISSQFCELFSRKTANLVELNVSRNKLHTLEHLPLSLEVVQACKNSITAV
jgi:hypothetical protein